MDENMLNTPPSTSKTKLIVGILVLLALLGGAAFTWYSKMKLKNNLSPLTTDSNGANQTNTTQPSSEENTNPTPNSAVPATPDTSGTDHSNPPSTTTPPSTSTSTVPRQDTGADTFDPGNLPPTTSTPPRPPDAQADTGGSAVISP